jgi:hypothetical protein
MQEEMVATFMGATGVYSATKELVFSCGCKIIAWSHILSCFLSFPRSWDYPCIEDKWEDYRKKVTSSLDERGAGIGIHPIALNRIRNSFCGRRALPFCEIFQYLLRNSVATDPRDFIYGLLGLLQITLDYELEPIKIYQQAAICYGRSIQSGLCRSYYQYSISTVLMSRKIQPRQGVREAPSRAYI